MSTNLASINPNNCVRSKLGGAKEAISGILDGRLLDLQRQELDLFLHLIYLLFDWAEI